MLLYIVTLYQKFENFVSCFAVHSFIAFRSADSIRDIFVDHLSECHEVKFYIQFYLL